MFNVICSGECMEPLNGLLDLEERRFISPQQNQSTGINADNPWIFELLPYVDAENKPTVTVEFKSKVEVHGFKLQGSGDIVKELQFVVSAKYEVDGLFVELEDEKLVADLTNQRVETVALPSPLSGLLALSLQLESVDQEDAGFGSLRFDVLGCEEGEPIQFNLIFIYFIKKIRSKCSVFLVCFKHSNSIL